MSEPTATAVIDAVEEILAGNLSDPSSVEEYAFDQHDVSVLPIRASNDNNC